MHDRVICLIFGFRKKQPTLLSKRPNTVWYFGANSDLTLMITRSNYGICKGGQFINSFSYCTSETQANRVCLQSAHSMQHLFWDAEHLTQKTADFYSSSSSLFCYMKPLCYSWIDFQRFLFWLNVFSQFGSSFVDCFASIFCSLDQTPTQPGCSFKTKIITLWCVVFTDWTCGSIFSSLLVTYLKLQMAAPDWGSKANMNEFLQLFFLLSP